MKTEVKDVLIILSGIIGIGVTFYIFGAEMPIYLFLAGTGLLVYANSENPGVKFIAGTIGRLFTVLFIISLFYYIGTKTFFPSDIFSFKFFKVGIKFTIDFISLASNFIGELVLKLIGIIIP